MWIQTYSLMPLKKYYKMKYIGVRGHRGAGKISISYLLGNTLEYLIKNKGVIQDDYNTLYDAWVDDVMTDENCIYSASLNNVMFESFSSNILFFIELITGIPVECLISDYYKDHMLVNLKDFTVVEYHEIPKDLKIYTHEMVYNAIPKDLPPAQIVDDVYMLLRDFIIYFGMDVMQRFFGVDVWIKSLEMGYKILPEDYYNDYKIYFDVKTPAEVSYIRNKEGLIININRSLNKKESKDLNKLSKDNRIDYNIEIKGSLKDLKNQIIDICKDIYSKR